MMVQRSRFSSVLSSLLLIAALGTAAAIPAAHASDIRVYPTRVVLTPQTKIAALNVRNNSTNDTVIQVEVLKWTQDGGEDVYEPSRDILANPVIFELAPGAEQILRVGLGIPAAANEQSYRIFLQEVPKQEDQPKTGITTLLRIGVPIFVPPAQSNHKLEWSLRPGAKDELIARVSNVGNIHTQITSYDMQNAAGESIAKDNTFTYILPGQIKEWPVKLTGAAKTGDNITVTAETDFEKVTAPVVIDSDRDRAK